MKFKSPFVKPNQSPIQTCQHGHLDFQTGHYRWKEFVVDLATNGEKVKHFVALFRLRAQETAQLPGLGQVPSREQGQGSSREQGREQEPLREQGQGSSRE